jgi:hypothetical protein
MHGPRSLATACAVLAGIEAVQMIRKGQVLGITKKNLHGQAWVSAICSVSTSLNSSPPSLTDRPFNTVATLPAQVFLQSLDTLPYKDFGRASTAFGPVDESVRGRRPTPPPASRGVREDDGIASGERWDRVGVKSLDVPRPASVT